jgi:hypothetical protein
MTMPTDPEKREIAIINHRNASIAAHARLHYSVGEKNGNFGKHHSTESKKLMSEIAKGDPRRSKPGALNPMFGKHPSPESIEKSRQKHIGRHYHTQEHKNDLRDKLKIFNPMITPEANKKRKETVSGWFLLDGNPNWKGGVSFGKYCPKCDKKFKQGVRKFYGYTCQICGHVWQSGEPQMAVHHVYYNRRSCCQQDEGGNLIHTLPKGERVEVQGDPNKFVIVCNGSCHCKTNHNRLEWALKFEKMINNLFDGKSYYSHEELDAMKAAHIEPPAYHPKENIL